MQAALYYNIILIYFITRIIAIYYEGVRHFLLVIYYYNISFSLCGGLL